MSLYSRTIGWARTGREQMVGAMLDTYDQNLAAQELGMFNWQWNYRARRVSLASEKIIASRIGTQMETEIGPIYSALNLLFKLMIPLKQEARFAKALNYAETDDKVSGIVETQVDFGLSGFRVASKDAAAEKKIQLWNRKKHIYNVLLEMWGVFAATDNVVVMMHTQTKALTILPLPNLKIIPMHVTDSKGRKQFRTFLKIPPEMKNYIVKILRTSKQDARGGVLKGIPEKWIKAAQHPGFRPAGDPIYPSGGYVELKEGDGRENKEKIFILNRKGIEDRLVDPSMMTVFPSIALRQLLQDGEFSIAYLIKYFIHQVKVGPKGDGKTLQQMLRAGTVSKEQREEVKDRYRTKVDKAFFEVTDQMLEHVFHFPGSDVDFGPRYATPDERINWWARISRQIVVGDKGSFSGGLIYLKGYSRKIARFRELVAIFLQDLYAAILDDPDAEVQWDEHFMKEPRQKLREVEMLTKRGMDLQTACSILGYSWSQFVSDREKTLSPEILKMKGEKDREHLYWQEIQTPFFEPNQGLLQDNPGGRPSTTEEQTTDNLTEETPRPEGVAGAEGVG